MTAPALAPGTMQVPGEQGKMPGLMSFLLVCPDGIMAAMASPAEGLECFLLLFS